MRVLLLVIAWSMKMLRMKLPPSSFNVNATCVGMRGEERAGDKPLDCSLPQFHLNNLENGFENVLLVRTSRSLSILAILELFLVSLLMVSEHCSGVSCQSGPEGTTGGTHWSSIEVIE